MTAVFWIGQLSQLFALCGLISIRIFLPAFLYFFALRLAQIYPDFFPELILEAAQKTPSWQLSTLFLSILGVLGVLEIAAMRSAELKTFLAEDFDRFFKPVMAMLLAAGVLSAAQNDQVQTLLQQSSAGGLIWFSVVLAGGITWFCCQMRNRLLKIIAAADPEGALGLQSLASVTGELTLIGGFLIALLLPVFALVMTLAAIGSAYLFQKWMAARQKRHSHPCPACGQNGVETPVLNCAVECPVCHTRQPEIRKTGLFGMISTDPIEEEQTHMIRLLTHGRCRFCASRLQGARQCPVCGKEQWTPELRSIYRKNNDFRAFLLFAAGGLCFLAPWVGLLIISIFFAPAAANPLTIHLNYSSRLLSKFLFSFCKFLLLIPLLLLATLPGIGLLTLLPYLVRYFFVRKAFLQKVF